MKRFMAGGIAAVALGALIFAATMRSTRTLEPQAPSPVRSAASTEAVADEPLQPVTAAVGLDPRIVALGRDLFHDRRFSRDNTISCASCHDIARGGADHVAHSVGVGGAVGDINAPTVLNSGFNFRQFWNGRAATLEDQIDGPTANPAEMGTSWPDILAKLNGSAADVQRFHAIYPDGVTRENIKNAIATYERSLVTPSRFDRFLLGDPHAITATEQQGYAIFKSYGCVSCHQGQNVGGNMYQHFGVMADYFADRGHVTQADFGRFNVTHDPADRFVFKVPSLRNVALTAPYFHDGTAPTLAAAVTVMGHYQLGRALTPGEIDLLVAFLGTLTGQVPTDAVPATPVAMGAGR